MKLKENDQPLAVSSDDSPEALSPILWHNGFFGAIQKELRDYRDVLEFIPEYELTTGSLKIDCVIIKKARDAVIDKNIARIFRANNLLEYKGPDDYLSVKDFLKVYAYANLYAAIIPDADFSDLSLTFIERRHPRKLLQYLTDIRGYAVTETSPGIYHIQGDYLPIQIIESKKLSETENLWLKSLTNNLEISGLQAILEERRKWESNEPIDAYMDIVLRANKAIFLEASKMLSPALEEIFTEAGIIPKWIERGVQQGLEQGLERGHAEGRTENTLEIARKLKSRGRPVAEIAEDTGLSFEAIEQL